MWIRKLVFGSMLLCLLQGCASLTTNPATQLIGKWQVEMAGVKLLVEYTGDMVQIGNNEPVTYTLNDAELSFENGGSQKRLIRFSGRNEMIQTDPLTGTERIYTRINSAS